MMVVTVVTVAAVPIVRPIVVAIIWPIVITIGIIVPIRVISVVARSKPNAEKDLSIGAWRRSKGQASRHYRNEQKFLHRFTSHIIKQTSEGKVFSFI